MEISQKNLQGNIPGAPPPPPEVKVRTMHSDLESMARSGGGAPRFQNVAIAGLSTQEGGSASAATGGSASAQDASRAPSKSLLGPILVTIVAIAAIAVVGYFAYTILSPSASQTTATSTTP